jgi:hypothetical protein
MGVVIGACIKYIGGRSRYRSQMMPVPLFQGRTPDIAGSQEVNWDNTSYKDPHTRMEPLALASSHGRYITVTPERTLVSVEKRPLHAPGSRPNHGDRRI